MGSSHHHHDHHHYNNHYHNYLYLFLTKILIIIIIITTTNALPLQLPAKNISIAVIAQLPGYPVIPVEAYSPSPFRDAWEHAAASQLAIDEINNSSQILPNHTLVPRYFDTNGDALTALRGVMTLCDPLRTPTPSFAIVGLFTDEVARAASITAAFLNVPTVSDWAPGADLSTALTYPTLSRIQSTDAVEASVILQLIRHFRWQRFAVVAPAYAGGVTFANELITSGLKNQFRVNDMASRFVARGSADALSYEDAVRQFTAVAELGFRVIVLHFFTFEMPTVVAALKALDMASGKFVFIGTRFWVFDVSLPAQLIDSGTGRSLLDGALGVSVRYDTAAPRYQDVLASWKRAYHSNPWLVFNISVPRIAFVRYDATYTVAHALHRLSEADHMCNRSSSSLNTPLNIHNYTCANLTSRSSLLQVLQAFVRASSFVGVTGKIEFDTHGNRVAEMSIINVQNTEMVSVGHADPQRLITDPKYLQVLDDNVRFFGNSKVVPLDRGDTEYEVLTPRPSLYVVILVCTVVSMVFTLSMFWFNVRYRNDVAVKMSSPNINLLTLLGAMMCLIFVLLSALRASSSGWSSSRFVTYCISSYWMLTLGFTLFFGSLFAKTYRVHRLFHALEHLNKGRPKKIYDIDLVKQIGVLLLFDCALMAGWSADHFQRKREVQSQSFDPIRRFTTLVTVSEVCTSSHFKTYVSVIALTKIGLVLFGTWLAYEVRNVRIPALNDSRWIGISIYTLVLLGFMAGPVILTVDDVDIAFFAIHFSAIVMVDMVLLALFGPQLHTVVTHQQAQVVSEHHAAPKRTSTAETNGGGIGVGGTAPSAADALYACSECAQTVASLRKRIDTLESRVRKQSQSQGPAVSSEQRQQQHHTNSRSNTHDGVDGSHSVGEDDHNDHNSNNQQVSRVARSQPMERRSTLDITVELA